LPIGAGAHEPPAISARIYPLYGRQPKTNMIEVLEKYTPHVIAALTQAGPDGLTVKELRGHLGASEQFVRRALTLLLATGAVRVSHRHRPGVRGAVPRVYQLAG
jgi:hypothetical protein